MAGRYGFINALGLLGWRELKCKRHFLSSEFFLKFFEGIELFPFIFRVQGIFSSFSDISYKLRRFTGIEKLDKQ
jgi:hypothetical protein